MTARSAAEPTLADVARKAGVSVATASRALSGSRQVSAARERKVREASRQLGYRPNVAAGALRSRRTGTIGLVLPRYSTAFLSALIEAVSAAVDREHMSVLLRYVDPDALQERDSIESLLSRRVDGVIICPPSDQASQDALAAAGGLPIVQVGRFVRAASSDSVGLDDDQATNLLISHLADGGAKRLMVVGLDPAVTADAHRIAALRLAADSLGLQVDLADPVPAILDGGITAASRLFAESITFDACVCANDDVASGLIAIARVQGISVPDDLQVASLLDVSFTDVGRVVTTLHHPWPAMGREAVRLLLDALKPEHDGLIRRVNLSPQLVRGTSTRG